MKNEQQILRDLQDKLARDVTKAALRTICLGDDTESRVALGLQAGCTCVSGLAQLLEQAAGMQEEPKPPRTGSIMIAAMMVVHSLLSEDGSTFDLDDLIRLARHDVARMVKAKIAVQPK